MKYMIIKGAKSSGKSVTVKEICKRLKPISIKKIEFDEAGNPVPVTTNGEELNGDNYLLTVKSKKVLVVPKAPTEQKMRITAILEGLKKLEVQPDFGIIAVSSLEKLKDFATAKELENFGQCVYETKIWRIPANEFSTTEEWNKRVSYLTTVASHYL